MVVEVDAADPDGLGGDGGDLVAADDIGAAPRPATLRSGADYSKDEVIEILGALADAEALLAFHGDPNGAAAMASLFDLVERRLVN